MTYLFIDTNIFLHYKFFIEIPWLSICNDDFELVLAPVVMDELDKHKRHQNRKTAERAKTVLIKLEQIIENPSSFSLQYITRRPSLTTFEVHQLDRQEQDDSILAAILEFKADHPNDPVILISNDTGPRFRAASLGISSKKLDDQYSNQIEKSEDQKLIQSLKQELSKYKNNVPKVSLCFKDGTFLFTHQLKMIEETTEDYMSSKLAAIQDKYPPMVWEDPEVSRKKFSEEMKSQPAEPLWPKL